MQKLPDMFGGEQILEPMLSQIFQAGFRREGVGQQFAGRLTYKRLLPMSYPLQSCYPVERGAEVVAIALLSLPGMEADAYPQPTQIAPLLFVQQQMTLQCGRYSIGGMCEGGAEGIAHRFEDVSTAALDGLPEEGVVTSQGTTHRFGMVLPEPRAPLDVGKQKSDDSARQFHAQ